MILAVDIGGTKTLLALCKLNGDVISEIKFETPKKYSDFKSQFAKYLEDIDVKKLTVISVALPAKIDRKSGVGIIFGNLDWKNVPIKNDINKLTSVPVIIENDANLAGLSEAHQLKPVPHKVLYITVSTGIGTGLITDGFIDPDFADSEGGHMLFEHDNKLQVWEKFASGKAIVAKYGKRASDLTDKTAWQQISHNLAVGIANLSAVLDPNVIVIGGGVGSHFNKFGDYLKKDVRSILPAMIDLPDIKPAKAAEQAVILGCIVFAKQYAKK